MSADGGLVIHAAPDGTETILHVHGSTLEAGGKVWRYLVTDVCGWCGQPVDLDDEDTYVPTRIGGDSANGYEPHHRSHFEEPTHRVMAIQPYASPNTTNREVAEWLIASRETPSTDVVISDGAARTIASWWQSSGTVGSHLAALASGSPVYARDVEADALLTVNEHPDMHGRDREALWALCAWVRQPAHLAGFTSEQEEES